ncbi:MAG TPA: hypothetical protein VFP44_00290 [Usitatibacter sp.]|nr:hypothetical protein [Usitatibacter sp.]
MTNARIERLTREALGPARRDTPTYTHVDDEVLRGVAIVVLVLTIIIFAAWPRDEAGAETHAHAGVAAQSIDARAVSVSRSSDRDGGTARKADNSPLY